MSGPHRKDENAMLTKMTELVATTRDAGTEKDSDISGMAANNAVLDMKAVNTIQLDTKTTRLLRHNGSVLVGQSRSSKDAGFEQGSTGEEVGNSSGTTTVSFSAT